MGSYQISSKPIELGWIDGTIDSFRFQAKVYDAGSRFGINDGRVSKLEIWNPDAGGMVKGSIASYDRGWDRKPATDEYQALYKAVLLYLEGLPPEEC